MYQNERGTPVIPRLYEESAPPFMYENQYKFLPFESLRGYQAQRTTSGQRLEDSFRNHRPTIGLNLTTYSSIF